MTTTQTTATIMNDGINHLIERLGVVETEIFISQLIKDPFDYTKWQKEHYAKMSVSELNEKAIEYAKNNPIQSIAAEQPFEYKTKKPALSEVEGS